MAHNDYQRIEQAIRFLDGHFQEQPSLQQVAAAVRLSPFHLQRLFRRWAGISPKRFLQVLTLTHAKGLLESDHSVLDAALEAGLSGPSRLHDLFITHEALSPGQHKRRGEGLSPTYGYFPSPFGECLLATTAQGICWLAFVEEAGRAAALQLLQVHWPLAELTADQGRLAPLARRVFRPQEASTSRRAGAEIALHLQGTNFQVKVWRALLRIAPGSVMPYGQLAQAIGQPGAARAIGAALGSNPVAFLIPCHRVIRQTGALGGYRWGPERKQAMLAWEQSRLQNPLLRQA